MISCKGLESWRRRGEPNWSLFTDKESLGGCWELPEIAELLETIGGMDFLLLYGNFLRQMLQTWLSTIKDLNTNFQSVSYAHRWHGDFWLFRSTSWRKSPPSHYKTAAKTKKKNIFIKMFLHRICLSWSAIWQKLQNDGLKNWKRFHFF